MDLIIAITLLMFSVLGNIFLVSKIKKSEKNKPKSSEFSAFMIEVLSGKYGLFSIQRVDTDHLMIRSPRGEE